MNRSILNIILLITSFFFASSCGSDDEPTGDTYVENSYLTGTYSNYSSENLNKLVLKYNGVELPQKEVSFYTSDNKIGKITFAHIIEGEAETVIDKIPLELNEEKGGLAFEGTYSTNNKELNYSGVITLRLLSISIDSK